MLWNFWWCILVIALLGLCAGTRAFLTVPDVFIIGTMKGGTTSLERLFDTHSQLCFGENLEKHYFDGIIKKADEYTSLFKECDSSQLTVDKTPSYIRTPTAPLKIKNSYSEEQLAKKKFILILRDPVERLYSEYSMSIRYCKFFFWMESDTKASRLKKADRRHAAHATRGRNGREGDTVKYKMCEFVGQNVHDSTISGMAEVKFVPFSKWMKTAKHIGHKDTGAYVSQIKAWTEILPRSQLLILQLETMTTETTMVSQAIAQFLGLKHDFSQNEQKQKGSQLESMELNTISTLTQDKDSLKEVGAQNQTREVVLPEQGYSKDELEEFYPPMTCKAVNTLINLYRAEYSPNLPTLINSAKDRPPMEPYWVPFDVKNPLKKCKHIK